jgi:hypothetical protein
MNESDPKEITSKLGRLVTKCISGEISFEVFLNEYGYPIGEYALDGHESDEAEKTLLRNSANSLRPHVEITETILNKLYIGEQVTEQELIQAGRIGPKEALVLLKEVAARHDL